MDDKVRCQSCAMPLGEGFFGTDINGNEVAEYCKFCYQNGAFTDPNLTMEDMIKSSVKHMMNELNMPEETAEKTARSFIPELKRWKQQ